MQAALQTVFVPFVPYKQQPKTTRLPACTFKFKVYSCRFPIDHGNTPLHLALKQGLLRAAQTLAAHGAAADFRNWFGHLLPPVCNYLSRSVFVRSMDFVFGRPLPLVVYLIVPSSIYMPNCVFRLC